MIAIHRVISRARTSILIRRLATGAVWTGIGMVFSRVIAIIAAVFLARTLGSSAFGEFGLVRSTIAMFLVFAGASTGTAATTFVSRYRHTDPGRASRMISLSIFCAGTIGLLASITIFYLAPSICEYTFGDRQAVVAIRIASIAILFSTLVGVTNGVLTGLENFSAIVKADVTASLLSLPLIVGGAHLWGVPGAVAGQAVSSAIHAAISFAFARFCALDSKLQIARRIHLSDLRCLVTFCVPATLSGVMVAPTHWLSQAMLARTPAGLAQIGILSAATNWQSALSVVPAVLGSAVLPMLSAMDPLVFRTRQRQVLIFSVIANATILLPISASLYILRFRIMNVYGEQFLDGTQVLPLLLVAATISGLLRPLAQLVVANDAMWLGFFMNFGWAAVFLFLSYSFRSKGAYGLALAQVIAYFVHASWAAIYAINSLTSEKPSAEHAPST